MESPQSPEVSATEAMLACRTCRFWQAHLPELVLGECRVNGPLLRERPGEPGALRLTADDDWCASWHMVRAARLAPPA